MSSTSRRTWVTWCCSCSVSTERQGFHHSVSCGCESKTRDEKKKPASPSLSLCCRYAVAAAQLLWIFRTRVCGSEVTAVVSLSHSSSIYRGFSSFNFALGLSREYCKRLHLSDNNTQFLQNFLSLMLDISPESDECECGKNSLQYALLLQTYRWDNCFVSQVTKASSTIWFWIRGSLGSWPLVFGRTRTWIRKSSLVVESILKRCSQQ